LCARIAASDPVTMKTPALALASDAAGTWVSQDGGLKVQLVDCGNRICGRVV
jgi:hypothetical protein